MGKHNVKLKEEETVQTIEKPGTKIYVPMIAEV